jgi:NAD(P)H-dependent FMN reductase
LITIASFSGSLRQHSYNTALLREAAALMPADSKLDLLSIREFPLYNGDDEAAHGVPDVVARLKDAIAAADGLLLATPEYNNSIPGVAKNALDWLTRPAADIPRVFAGKPVAIVGASPGGFGTILAQNAWLPIWRTLGADLWTGGRLLVSRAGSAFDVNGKIVDESVRETLRKFLDGFVAKVRNRRAAACVDLPPRQGSTALSNDR